MSVREILACHEYSFGFVSNCNCGTREHIWTWEDWIDHVAPLIEEATVRFDAISGDTV